MQTPNKIRAFISDVPYMLLAAATDKLDGRTRHSLQREQLMQMSSDVSIYLKHRELR